MNSARFDRRSLLSGCALGFSALLAPNGRAVEQSAQRIYENRLARIYAPKPLLADHPEFVEPVREVVRYEAPALIEDAGIRCGLIHVVFENVPAGENEVV